MDDFRSKDVADLNCKICEKEKINHKIETYNCKCRGFVSLPRKSIHFKNTEKRDIYLNWLLSFSEMDITTFVHCLDDFEKLMKNSNRRVSDFLKGAF